MRFPYAVCLDGTGDTERPAVADTANNRILLWDGMPDGPISLAARTVPGRHALFRVPTMCSPNQISAPTARTAGPRSSAIPLCWPYGLSLHGDLLAVVAELRQQPRHALVPHMRPRIIQTDGQIGFYWATAAGAPTFAAVPAVDPDEDEPDRLVATHLDDAPIIAAERFGEILGGGRRPADADERDGFAGTAPNS